jgi:hypothetical protein
VEAGSVELLATRATRAEWLDVIERPKFALDEARRAAIAARYDSHARIVATAEAPAPLPPVTHLVEPAFEPPVGSAVSASVGSSVSGRPGSSTRAPLGPGARALPLICRDRDDQKFLDLALLAGAPFLVTRDRALLDLGRQALRHHSLLIVRPDVLSWRDALSGHL